MTVGKTPLAPSPWVVRCAALIPAGGAVLDLACGGGRHSRWLAERGHQVEAVDQDAEALASLADVAGVHTRCADLEGGPWPYGGRAFAGIVVTNFLWRPLLPFLLPLLEPGGVLIYETFMVGNEAFRQPTNPAYLLRPGELLEVVRGRLSVIAFEQGQLALEPPAVVQRLCAQRAGTLHLPD